MLGLREAAAAGRPGDVYRLGVLAAAVDGVLTAAAAAGAQMPTCKLHMHHNGTVQSDGDFALLFGVQVCGSGMIG